ncbi:MAG TPA: hypothetical protein DCL73_09105 [Treponema sp.]|nr:hypothetical protein [Treponema sp.]
MFGIVRTIEYNRTINQSRLHFECIHIEPQMKNEVLSFVYNIMPQEEKEIYDALSLTDEDQNESSDEDNKKNEDVGKKQKPEQQPGTQNTTDDFLPNLTQENQAYSVDAAAGAGETVSEDTLNAADSSRRYE